MTKPLRLLLAGLAIAAVAAGLAYGDAAAVDWLLAWAKESPAAPLVFVLAFAVATVAFLPGAPFGLAGGALFGPAWGTLWNLGGALLGAAMAFLVARHAAGDWVARRTGGRIAELVRGIEDEGWRFVAFVRLVPLFPFNLLNYALGLTRIPFRHYMAASALAMLPGVILYTWIGFAGREAIAGSDAAPQVIAAALALLAAAAFLPRLVRRWRGAQPRWIEAAELEALLAGPRRPEVIDVRGAEEFDGALGHIAGARNLPLPRIEEALRDPAGRKDRPLVLVCHTQNRSRIAAARLAAAGFADVRVLRGGMLAWSRRRTFQSHETTIHPQ